MSFHNRVRSPYRMDRQIGKTRSAAYWDHHHHHYSACTISAYCVAPLAANSPHKGLSRAISIASSKVRLCRDKSFFRVAIQEEWGRPTGLLQSLWGTAVRILGIFPEYWDGHTITNHKKIFHFYDLCFCSVTYRLSEKQLLNSFTNFNYLVRNNYHSNVQCTQK